MGFSPEVLNSATGLLLIVIAAFVGAIGLVAIKRVHELEPLELQAWLAWGSLPILLPLSLMLEDGQLASVREAGLAGWGALLYSAVLASLVAHTAYFALIRRYPVSSVAPVTVLTPLFSVFFSVLLLGDVLDARMVVGGLAHPDRRDRDRRSRAEGGCDRHLTPPPTRIAALRRSRVWTRLGGDICQRRASSGPRVRRPSWPRSSDSTSVSPCWS